MLSREVMAGKLKAVAASLAIFSVFSIALLLAARFWLYPDFMFALDGGVQGLRLVLLVDLVLGPLLAFIIFNPGKSRREQVMDIALVAVIQFSAMSWGSYLVWSERPVAVVYGGDRFVSVTSEILRTQNVRPADLQQYSDRTPPFVFRREPVGRSEQERFSVMVFKYFIHSEAQVWLFEKFLPNREAVFSGSAVISGYIDASMKEAWQEWANGREQSRLTDYRFAFYQGRDANAVLIFSPAGAYRGYLRLPGKIPAFDEASGQAASVDKPH